MATIKHHQDIVAWQLANKLKIWVLKIIARPSGARHFKFCDQIRDSSRIGDHDRLAHAPDDLPRESRTAPETQT
jgi:hypothetical protein